MIGGQIEACVLGLREAGEEAGMRFTAELSGFRNVVACEAV